MGQRAASVTDFDVSLAEEIRVELARRGDSGRWLARQTGLSYTYMVMRLRAERPFTAGDISRIAAALEVPAAELWRRADVA